MLCVEQPVWCKQTPTSVWKLNVKGAKWGKQCVREQNHRIILLCDLNEIVASRTLEFGNENKTLFTASCPHT